MSRNEMTSRQAKLEAFGRLLDILDELREKCPWDRKQTTESLRPQTIEETYELSDAILRGDGKEVSKELGDVLLHVVFYSWSIAIPMCSARCMWTGRIRWCRTGRS